MSDLADFLLARISEDEERAQLRIMRARHNREAVKDPMLIGRVVPGWHDWPDLEADARRALVDVEAKRVIVNDAVEVPTTSMRHVLRLLAVSYSSHPDFREEWLPAGWSVESCQTAGAE